LQSLHVSTPLAYWPAAQAQFPFACRTQHTRKTQQGLDAAQTFLLLLLMMMMLRMARTVWGRGCCMCDLSWQNPLLLQAQHRIEHSPHTLFTTRFPSHL
jgi:hypothetical protein